MDEEIDFILDQAGQYLTRKPKRSNDVLAVFADCGRWLLLRKRDSKKTKEISRNHKIYVSDSGMLTITGGNGPLIVRWPKKRVNKVAALIGLETEGLCDS